MKKKRIRNVGLRKGKRDQASHDGREMINKLCLGAAGICREQHRPARCGVVVGILIFSHAVSSTCIFDHRPVRINAFNFSFDTYLTARSSLVALFPSFPAACSTELADSGFSDQELACTTSSNIPILTLFRGLGAFWAQFGSPKVSVNRSD
jgi:hypothetical protein